MSWDDPRVAAAYERFCEAHSRYREANDALVAHAAPAGVERVLDVGAGTGRTAEAALPHLPGSARVVCVEPAAAMAAEGARRLRDPRVTWRRELPEGEFARVLCGAGIWQLLPLHVNLGRLAALLSPSGALCFDIPGLYLGLPDEPGGGADPHLLALQRELASEARAVVPRGEPDPALAGPEALTRALHALGLEVETWSFSLRMTQEAYAAWLTLPTVSEGLMPGVEPDERARRIERALARVDRSSWRWERWCGWTAWKR